jgi:magnesium transporter
MQNIICYNEREVREGQGSKEDIKKGFNLWIDIVDPSASDLFNIQQSFNLDNKAVETFVNKSKKFQIRILEDHTFTVFLDLKYKGITNLDTEAIYFFLGKGWLITIHSSRVDLMTTGRKMFAEKNKRIIESPTDALYYSILSSIVERYEQLLAAIELKALELEKQSLYRPTRKTLENMDILSKQGIILRRYFWQARRVMNFLTNMEENKEDIKYLQMVYDDINQLIELMDSYHDTINSTRELYAASMSLQLNDTMRVLTIFSTILLPLTFLTGIFGMQGFDLNNLNAIPQGFTILGVIMAAIVIFLFYLFWKRQWIFVKNNIGYNDLSPDINSKDQKNRQE